MESDAEIVQTASHSRGNARNEESKEDIEQKGNINDTKMDSSDKLRDENYSSEEHIDPQPSADLKKPSDSKTTISDVDKARDGESMDQLKDDKFEIGNSMDLTADVDLSHDRIESDFKAVLNDLSEDPALSSFRVEYARIHAALLDSHRNERRMMTKCRKLQVQISSSSADIAEAHKRAEDAKDSIEYYKSEVEKAWRMIDIANEKDQEAKDTMEALQVEINRLRQISGREDLNTSEKVSAMDRLTNTKEGLAEERDRLAQEIIGLRSQLEKANEDCDIVLKAKEELQAKLDSSALDMQLLNNDLQREIKRKERAERDVKNAQKDIEAKHAELKAYAEQLEKGRENLTKMEGTLREQKTVNEKSLKELEALNMRHQKLQQEYETQLAHGNQLVQENQLKTTEMKNREEQLSSLRTEMNKLFKQRDNTQKQLRTSEERKQDLEEKQNTLTAMINALEKDLESTKKQIESDKKAYESLRHEKEMLKKEMVNNQSASAKQASLIKLHVQVRKSLELETQQLKQANADEKVIIVRLEKDRERCIAESAEMKQKVLDLIEDQKTKDMEIFEMNKRLSEADAKLKQRQSLYESVSKEKDLYRKNLIETQHEVAEMNKKMQITSHQIDRLKEENSSREALLQKEELEMNHILKEKENLLSELDGIRTLSTEMKQKIVTLDAENSKLNRSISEAEQERENLKKEVSQAMSERDFLGAQIVRRNNEISQMQEKIRVQQSLLSKGEQQYRQRVEDIELLKAEAKKLMRDKMIQGRSIHTLEDMQREMYSLHKDLLQERSKCKALEEELSRPQNIHRWRKLQGSDPEQYELILKVQALQKRLIGKMEEIAVRDREIQEKEKEYVDLKAKLNRQPAADMAEKFQECQASMRQKIRQMKSITAEIHMYEHQIDQYKCENEKLTAELKEMRRNFLEQKKKNQQQSQKKKTDNERKEEDNPPQLKGKCLKLIPSA